MADALLRVPTDNALQYRLDTVLSDSETSALTLDTNVAGVVRAPGLIVVDRINSSSEETPDDREYISFTGVSGTQLTGLTRGLAGSTAQEHAVSAIVEFIPDVIQEERKYQWSIQEHTDTGIHASLVSLTALKSDYITANEFRASGASLTGLIPLRPVFVHKGNASAASTLGAPLTLPQSGTFEYVNAVLRSPVSGASLIVDVYKNGTSIFDSGTRPAILGGGTFVSGASLATKTFTRGDLLTAEVINGNGDDLSIFLESR